MLSFSYINFRKISTMERLDQGHVHPPDLSRLGIELGAQRYTAREIPFMYYFSGNSPASAPISTFMYLRAIYIVPGSVYIFPPAE